MSDLTIKANLRLGFGVMFAVVALLAANNLLNLSDTRRNVDQVVNRIQPAVLDAMELANRVDTAAKALGFYLLGQEESHQQAYSQEVVAINETLERLKSRPMLSENGPLRERVDSAGEKITQFAAYRNRMLELAVDRDKNIPAFAYAAKNINPYSRETLQLLSMMLISEATEEVSEERRELLLTLGDLRYSWVNVILGVRSYLAFRTDGTRQDIINWMANIKGLVARLQEKPDVLTFDQADALEQFIKFYRLIEKNLPGLFALHGSEGWRTDSHLIRAEIGPLVHGIKSDLDNVVQGLRGAIRNDSDLLLEQVDRGRLVVLVLLVAGLLLAGGVSWLIMRRVLHPIGALQAFIMDTARTHDYHRRMDMSGNNEVARTAQAYDLLLESIEGVVTEVNETIGAIARGDFKRRIESDLTGQLARLKDGVNGTADSVQRTMGQLKGVLNAVRQADFSYRMDDSETEGEFREAVRTATMAMQEMRDVFTDINKTMDAMTRGDLTVRVKARATGELDLLKNRINISLECVSNAFEEIAIHIRQVAAVSSEASAAIGQVSDGSQEQRQGILQLSTAFAQTNQSVEAVSRSAVSARERIQETGTAVRNGQEKMRQMIVEVQAIAESSQKINKITEVIAEIANRTNLLSLNAAIEAARVGEAGKGFAVVAEEVRKLAESSAQSVEEIGGLVGQAVGQVHSVGQAAGEVSSEMERINAFASDNEEMIQLIAASMEQQTATVREITGNVDVLDRIAENNAASAEQITATMVDLSRIADEANSSINAFNTGQGKNQAGKYAQMRKAHIGWRRTVEDVVRGRQSAESVDVVSHRDCDLGKWLYGGALEQYGHLPEMAQLEQDHAQMHHCVAEAIAAAKSGVPVDQMPEACNGVRELSGKVVSHLYHIEEQLPDDGKAG